MSASIACIPDWRADETLYSWTAGFHAIYGNGSARDTGALLFGAEHACRERDAPTNLHHFVEATRSELGDVRSVLFTRSPIGLFAPFLPASRQQVLADRLGGARDDGPGWRLLCGMPASCLGDPTTLHYCKACVAEDLTAWGYPRWRLPHQLAGAWVCLDHGGLLNTLKSNVSQWLLPPIESSGTDPPTPDRLEAVSLKRMAMLAQRLIGVAPLDIGSIRQAVLVGLRDHAVTSWTHPLDRSQLASWFAQSPIAAWMKSSNGPWHRLASGQWVHDLLRNRTGDHPLKWMLLWCTLFADEDEEASYRRFIDLGSAPHWDASGQGTIWGTSSAAVPPDIQRIIAEAATLKEAASSLGLTVFSLRKRLSKLGTNAREFRLDTSWDQRKGHAMDSIRKYIDAHPTCSRIDIHRNCKAALAWIRANDPELLSLAMNSIGIQRSRQMALPFASSHF
ncbi:TniQ family protein [Delftia tsuruhatensis]|uniref:TniQ family protein n=1 Tax=Delftia tsuruhatensis TaxID=180282 RepID=UPI003D1B5329